MISIAIAGALMLQTGSVELRSAYVDCLKQAVVSAKGAGVAADAFKDYAQKTCATAEEGLKAKLVGFNVKNGMTKAAAAKDADIQLDDYVYTYGREVPLFGRAAEVAARRRFPRGHDRGRGVPPPSR